MQQIKRIIWIISIIFISCNTKEQEARQIVKQWLGKEIILPDSLKGSQQDSLWRNMLNKDFKILTFIDTNDCTECRLKLYEWKKHIQSIDSFHSNHSFIFIVHAKDYHLIETIKKKNKFNYPIIYDYKNKIGSINQFPPNPHFQTFLLDRNNKVILIGNPINNTQLWNLYKQIILE